MLCNSATENFSYQEFLVEIYHVGNYLHENTEINDKFTFGQYLCKVC